MPGIVVGIDGSDHSRRALEWAVNEAAVRQAPLLLTVNQAIVGSEAAPSSTQETLTVPGRPRGSRSRRHNHRTAQDPGLGSVEAVTGFPAEELLRAAPTPT